MSVTILGLPFPSISKMNMAFLKTMNGYTFNTVFIQFYSTSVEMKTRGLSSKFVDRGNDTE